MQIDSGFTAYDNTRNYDLQRRVYGHLVSVFGETLSYNIMRVNFSSLSMRIVIVRDL